MITSLMEQKAEYVRQQLCLKEQIDTVHTIKAEEIRQVAGVDLAYWKEEDGEEYAVCCIVVLDYASREVVEKRYCMDRVAVPYIPGCLAFRELPLFFQAKELLENDPDLYVFDGNGYLHPRNMGIATHAGILLDKPSIGIAKTYYKIADTDFIMPENRAFAYENIVLDGEVSGRAVRTQKDVKPIFLSIGNKIQLDTAMEIVRHLTTKESHIPLPTRLADWMTHEVRREVISCKKN